MLAVLDSIQIGLSIDKLLDRRQCAREMGVLPSVRFNILHTLNRKHGRQAEYVKISPSKQSPGTLQES